MKVRILPPQLPLCAGKINRNAGGTSQFWGPPLVRVALPGMFPLCVVRKCPGVASGLSPELAQAGGLITPVWVGVRVVNGGGL
jgi:hypothetical protein